MSAELRTQSEAVVAATLKEHYIEAWTMTASYICTCKARKPHMTFDEALAHQAAAVMRALDAWVRQ